jgi:hypothetical protein
VSYPQPNADQYSINGYQYFRLNTLLSSPGDIYESAQSGLSLALGPDSDISKVDVAYFDDQVPTFMQRTSIGPERSFAGRMDARNEVTYQPAARPGRVLFWASDLYDPAFRPAGFNILTDQFNVVAPRLDVLQYFQAPASLSTQRNDKTYNFQNIVTGAIATADTWLMLPYWGRRYAMIELTNKAPDVTAFALYGINFAISINSAGFHQQTELVPDSPLIAGAQLKKIVRASVDGMFDMLLMRFHRVNPNLVPLEGPVRVYVSDKE